MLKCDSDLVKASKIKLMTEPEYIVRKPVILKQILNDLMTQFSELQLNNGSLISIANSTAQINPVQLFDLKPANCALYTPPTMNGLYIVKNMRAYLIDLDGYYITHSNTRIDGNWSSSFPPIEFYKKSQLKKSYIIEPIDFKKLIDSHSNYYKHGLHLSWMLGILIYQMINYYSNSHASETDKSKFFDFNNYKKHLLRNCNAEYNLFTSLDNFVDSLDEPSKLEWMTVGESGKSFLDEIKSCLYFDDGVYDSYSLKRNDNRRRPAHHLTNYNYTSINKTKTKMKKIAPGLDWSEPLTNNNSQSKLGQRRRFYNDDGTPNLFL